MKNKDPLIAAREYAFLLLKFRLRSEGELYSRLKKKKFPDQVIKETLAFLKGRRFIDDVSFTKVWIQSRIKKPYGLRRIEQELRLKGIDKNIINSQISEIKQVFPEGELVKQIALERLNRLKGIDPSAAKRRVYAYLMRRGFSPETITEALN